ncbi:Zinc fingerC2H2 type family protein, partial [Aphelenchoides avenae]
MSSRSAPKQYICKQCQHVSMTKEENWRHARTHIPPEKQLICNLCEFATEYKHHLEFHIRNHNGEMPLK